MDLNRPLGMTARPPKGGRRLASIAVLAAVGLALAGAGVFLATADPHGGEPYAISTIPPAADMPPRSAAGPDTTPTGSIARSGTGVGPANVPSMNTGSVESGVRVFRGSEARNDPSSASPGTGPLIIDVTRALDDPLHKAPTTTAPAATASPAPGNSSPRIAIFVEGMGLSDAATRTATDSMPAAVDLAFVPYSATVGAEVAAAKAAGHEVLLQLPMETAGGSRPGPHALRSNEMPQELAGDLGWLMGRFEGYAGVTNLLGAPVSASTPTMTAILKSVATRGLFYLDDGTAKASVAASLAASTGAAVLQADVVIDATNDPGVVRANLERLESIARKKGQAIGMASGLPDHLDAIARFAKGLDGRGISLVPVGALAGAPANVATAR